MKKIFCFRQMKERRKKSMNEEEPEGETDGHRI